MGVMKLVNMVIAFSIETLKSNNTGDSVSKYDQSCHICCIRL